MFVNINEQKKVHSHNENGPNGLQMRVPIHTA